MVQIEDVGCIPTSQKKKLNNFSQEIKTFQPCKCYLCNILLIGVVFVTSGLNFCMQDMQHIWKFSITFQLQKIHQCSFEMMHENFCFVMKLHKTFTSFPLMGDHLQQKSNNSAEMKRELSSSISFFLYITNFFHVC